MVKEIVALDKKEKNYDLINLILKKDIDLVDNKLEVLLKIANIIILYYQKREEEYRKNLLGDYKKKAFTDWNDRCWEATLDSENLKIRLRSSREVKNPVRHSINRKNLFVYCGCMNYYFCDTEEKECYCVPKNRRVITKSNKKHEISIYDID